MKKYLQHIAADLPAAIVVFLVALPLCLGIALGSGAPLFSGIIAGIIGGIVVGTLSGSQLSVSGPTAGLTIIVVAAITKLPSYNAFLLAVVIAGCFQILLGYLKAGIVGSFLPNSVIKGMLAAIGIILILKQFPHFIGYDTDFEGDESFLQDDHENTFTEVFKAIRFITPSALFIGAISLVILVIWEFKKIKSSRFASLFPGPLAVVIISISCNEIFKTQFPAYGLEDKHLVTLPIAKNLQSFFSFFSFPDWYAINNQIVWTSAFTLAIVASLETLLGIEAIDKLDPQKRISPPNVELKAQGVGNIVSGLIGGIPITSVVVRSSANLTAGGKTKAATIFHGLLLLLCVACIPSMLNRIPLSALAAILIFLGYKLVRLKQIKEFYKNGYDQFIPFMVTIVAILMSNLLVGIVIGILVALFYIIRINFRSSIFITKDKNSYLIRLRKDVSFLNKPIIRNRLKEIPPYSFVLIDALRTDFVDKDIIEEINNFIADAPTRNITVEIKKSSIKQMHLLFHEPKI
jgi:MFS superfamily sulfate permease-like transporter